jgi:hypothetical protein
MGFMEKEQIEKKIEGRLDCMEESLYYQLRSQCELLGDIHTIQYLRYLLSEKQKITN